MRTMLALTAVSLMLAVTTGCSSSADEVDATESDVVTARCPTTLSASFSRLVTSSIDAVATDANVTDARDRTMLSGVLARARTVGTFDAALTLETRNRGECTYRASDDSKAVAKLYSRNGKDILRIDGTTGKAADLSFFVTVAAYAADAITVAPGDAGVFYRWASPEGGWSAVKLGRATEARVGLSAAESGATAMSDATLAAELQKAVEGLSYGSEADAPFDVLEAPLAVNEQVNAATLKRKFPELAAGPGAKEGDLASWFQRDLANEDGTTAASRRYTQGLERVRALMTSSMTDLKVIWTAEESLDRSMDVGLVQIFLVGRSRNGTLFAIHTSAVWT